MSTDLSTEGFIGAIGTSGSNPPVITAITPTPNTTPGAAGGMSANYSIARSTPIVIDIADSDGAMAIVLISVTALFLDGTAETVYLGGGFSSEYSGSSQTPITNGIQLSISRLNFWPGQVDGLGNLAVGIQVDAAGADGSVDSTAFYYEMPLAVPVPPTPGSGPGGSSAVTPHNRIEALLAILVKPFQDVENAFVALNSLLSIELMGGVNLDAIGKILVQPRGGADDPTYRCYLRAKIVANRSTGRREDLIDVARLVLNDPTLGVQLRREGTATARMLITGGAVTSAVAAVLCELVIPAAALGVRLIVEWSTSPPADTFTFDVGPGFDNGLLADSSDQP